MSTINTTSGNTSVTLSSDPMPVLEAAPDARFSEFNQSRSKQHFLYILNTTFLVLIAFTAGYNLKAYQVRNAANDAVQIAGQYISLARSNYEKSTQLLNDLTSKKTRHFEAAVSQEAKKAVLALPDTAVSSPDAAAAPEPHIATPETTVIQTPDSFGKTIQKPVVTAPPKPEVTPAAGHTSFPPPPEIKYENVYHTISDGEIVSEMVPKALVNDFLAANPMIKDPDIIYPGQTVVIKVPLQNIKNGSYMSSYFIRSRSEGQQYYLTKWLKIPEEHSLLSFLALEKQNRIRNQTSPYINISDYAATIKEEIFGNDIQLILRNTKVSRISPSQTGLMFRTVKSHPIFLKNEYLGVKNTPHKEYDAHISLIKDYLIKYLASVQANDINRNFFHFFIFGETIVQTGFLGRDIFTEAPDKARIRIGLVYNTPDTGKSLLRLQRALSLCKINNGDIAEVTRTNLKYFNRSRKP